MTLISNSSLTEKYLRVCLYIYVPDVYAINSHGRMAPTFYCRKRTAKVERYILSPPPALLFLRFG